MFDHVSIGVRDIAAAKKFYDAALGTLGCTCVYEGGDSLGYGRQSPNFWVSATAHAVPADPQSGLHICFTAPSRAAVDAFHAKALGAGGGDNGQPGLRPDYSPSYYAAFVTDPDGYRLEACCLSQA